MPTRCARRTLSNFGERSRPGAGELNACCWADGSTFGVIELDVFGRRGRFSEDDLDLLATVAQQLGIFIENARLHEVALRQQRLEDELRRLEHGLEVARKVQRSLLPATPPRIAGYQFHVYEPAEQVGAITTITSSAGHRLAIVVLTSGRGCWRPC